VLNAAGDINEYIGTTMDITQRKQGEEALRNAQADLARAARLTTMGELAASIAHEINQPLASVVSSGNACLRWLANDRPKSRWGATAAETHRQGRPPCGDIIRSLSQPGHQIEPEMTQFDIMTRFGKSSS